MAKNKPTHYTSAVEESAAFVAEDAPDELPPIAEDAPGELPPIAEDAPAPRRQDQHEGFRHLHTFSDQRIAAMVAAGILK